MMMKSNMILWMMALAPAGAVIAQQTAITQTGEQVVLYENGTWVYAGRDSLANDEIPRNLRSFTKRPDSDFLITSKRINVGCWINPKKWTFRSAEPDEAAEYELEHESGSLYALMITENLDIPLVSLGNIALDNARAAAPDLNVISKEYRTVNGFEVLMLRMTGTIQGIRFSYFGYYYTADDVATQFLAYSSEAFMNDNLEEVEELLNGFINLED